MSRGAGVTTGGVRRRLAAAAIPASTVSRAMSPGMITTATPRRPTATRIAVSSTAGSCEGCDTSSQ